MHELRSIAALAALATALLAGGCAEKVHVRTAPPGSHVILDGKDLGQVPAEGTTVEVGPGLGPVPFELRDAAGTHTGEIARSEVNWWLVAAGIGGAACCLPTAAAAGLCVANPALLTAGLGCLLGGGNFGVCCTALAQPSWCTLPFGAAGAAVGASPLAALFFAEQPPKEVVLKSPGTGGGAGDDDGLPLGEPSDGAMPW